jgi:hypothetical protein
MCKESFRIIAFAAAVFLFFSTGANAFSNKKVILLAAKDGQSDSFGYNFVSDFSAAAYKWISNGSAVLWNSPEKKTTLTVDALKEIEKSSKVAFNSLNNIFIYENWTSSSRRFSFSVKGFSFTGTNAKGEDVLFGFIEYNTQLKDLLKSTPMRVNANGNFASTLFSALMNMEFQYNLVYFDNGPLQDYKNSSRIVSRVINPGKKMVNTVRLPETRLIEYGWDSTDLQQSKLSDQLTAVISDFFNKNKQEFFNYGGDKYYSYLKNNKILITGFHVVQEWTKDKNGKITYNMVSIIPYTVGIPLLPVPVEKLEEWGLKYNDASFSEYLNNHDFPFAIKKINETMIPVVISDWIKSNLYTGDWKHILSKNLHTF